MKDFEMPSFTKIGEFAQLLVNFIKGLLEILGKVNYGFAGYETTTAAAEEETEANLPL